MIWYVATLARVVLVEAETYGQAQVKGRKELRQRFYGKGRVNVVTCRQATRDDISLHLLGSNVELAGVK